MNYMLISMFGFNQQNFPFITIALVIIGVLLYLFLSKSLLDPLFRSDEQIQSLIKETLHELNTPVSTIQINAKMIKRKELNEKNIQRLDRIEQSCENLLKLYSQMEYELKKEVDAIAIESFSLEEVIEKCISNFDDIKKEITITSDITKDVILSTDKSGFEKVINNLISNAIKYNKSNGFVKIAFKDNTISIEDSGIGIDTENLFKVFDKYYQQNSENDGVGLGLNIVKDFCDKHKIKVNIDSKHNTGTTFFLDISSLV